MPFILRRKRVSVVEKYIEKVKANGGVVSTEMIYYLAEIELISRVSPEIAKSIVKELSDQRTHLKLIASENYSSIAVQSAMGSLLTDKYSEGYPYHRFYAGCDNVDDIEAFACKKACELFGAEHAYVQPHSGADANLCAYWAILNHKIQNPILEELGEKNVSHLSREDWLKVRKATGGQKILGLDYYSGGHLTHGYRQNVSAQMFDSYSYGVNKETGLLDYDEIERLAMEIKPLILIAGYSAYPRKINFKRMKEIADKSGAVLMCDMAHFAGLVAGGVFSGEYNPVLWADVVTSTTHKTLRGPRGGLILCKEEFAESVDKGCPLVIGGPLPHVMAAKALSFVEAGKPEFREYAHKIAENAGALASACMEAGLKVCTGGTENHLMLIDVSPFGLNGRQAEAVLREAGITLNRNALPFDPNGPWYTSGLRLGTAALTTLGMGTDEMREIAQIIADVLKSTKPAVLAKADDSGHEVKTLSKNKYEIASSVINRAKDGVQSILKRFVLYPALDAETLGECIP